MFKFSDFFQLVFLIFLKAKLSMVDCVKTAQQLELMQFGALKTALLEQVLPDMVKDIVLK